jgi:hypothetical protein
VRRVIVAFARALAERASDPQLDEPAPREDRIGGEIDVDVLPPRTLSIF